MRPADCTILAHVVAHSWLSLTLSLIDLAAAIADPPDPPVAVAIEPRGPNNLERSCQ